MAKPRVLILHNVISPYRLPVFEYIAGKVQAEVWFTRAKTADRKWDISLDGHHFPAKILPSWLFGPLFINPTLPRELWRNRFDMYLVGDFPETMLATFLTIAVAKLRRKPVILWSETTSNDVNYYQGLVTSPSRWSNVARNLATGLATAYRRLLLKLPNQFIALSQDARTFLINEGIDDSRIATGQQIMPLSQLPEPTVTKAQSDYADLFTILYIGYLNPAKAVDDLITAVREIDDPKLRLVIVGSGPDEHRLHELAAKDSRVVFTGYVGDLDVKANYYAAADVFVLPTLADCWGMVVNEALRYGVPVITTDQAAAREVVADGRAGLVLPARQPGLLAGALRDLMADPKRRTAMAQSARRLSRALTDPVVGATPILEAIERASQPKRGART